MLMTGLDFCEFKRGLYAYLLASSVTEGEIQNNSCGVGGWV